MAVTEWITIATRDEFRPGESRLVEINDVRIAVFNLDGEYYAIEDVCTHDGSPLLGCGLDVGDLLEGDEIICPRHGARFSIRTGEALTPPAYEPTTAFEVRVNNGIVQLRGPDSN